MTTSRRTSALALAALIGAGAFALAGCASGSATPASSGGAASGSSELEVDAGWLDGGRSVAVVTYGSSGCVPTASDVTLEADGSVAVTLEDPQGDIACTADYAPRATAIALPEGTDATKELDLVVTYNDARGDTDLDAYTGGTVEEYAPSAGWIDDGMFAIMTWGSSTCAPVVEDVTAEGSAVTVTFATPPADQACTMDMVPRVTLATAPGDIDDDNATVTLTGGDAQFATPVTIPIEG